ncbi:GH1 family beta-glucosidase [Salininema proteolyticum]|uniref:Beta-glucosidase n=1 Tax=Salininema proteolyticum TaxID=1607685 RepID=A0ABV8TXL2_9ACTN
MTALRFPDAFRWGTATAAYQVEGAVDEDGRGPSVWDAFSAEPGRVHRGQTGAVACDHYHRWRDDVALMADLGLQTYRFSISWPRVQPDGSGPVNPKGVEFYDRLVDELLEAGIDPMPTLYHWDLPRALQDRGGWTERETVHRFAEYADTMGSVLADRVGTWWTINEPWCVAYLGHASGEHAPGHRDPAEAFTVVHHQLLAHGLAVKALRTNGADRVSMAVNPSEVRIADDVLGSPDIEHHVARRIIDGLATRIFLDPVLKGHYPSDVIGHTMRFTDWSFVRPGDLAAISEPIDMLGVNYYSPAWVKAEPGAPAMDVYPGSEGIAGWEPADLPRTAMDWPVDATGLRDLLLRLHRDYRVPLYVTENGTAVEEKADADGRVEDRERIDYLRSHIAAVHEAIEQGADVRGYTAWSLMDNFEWAYGYAKRFGLVRVDYRTQRRVPKASAHWFSQVVRDNGLDV